MKEHEGGRRPFVQLERVENGFLVHYESAKTYTIPAAKMLHRTSREVQDFYIVNKTVYCSDLDAVNKAVERAWKAQEWLDKLEQKKEEASSAEDFA